LEILDLAGPMQAFGEANRSRPRYRMRSVATRETITTAQGLKLAGLEPLPETGPGTLIVVPGVAYPATMKIPAPVIRWLRQSYASGATIASVCTGSFVIGAAGLLDGRKCTTHWSRIDDLARRFPRATVLADRLYVSDGRIVSSAGIVSGIDMTLALIEQNDGPLVAAEVAREMVVYIRRDGGQTQTSIYLDYRTHLHPGIHRVQDHIVRNPGKDLSLDELSDLGAVSRRHLTRLFRRLTGISIKEYATRVRLELAGALLNDPSLTVDSVARRCGFSSARHLRRIWQRAHGTTPGRIRA
jgi:transcriptional regulator GlxA family with amidase domain